MCVRTGLLNVITIRVLMIEFAHYKSSEMSKACTGFAAFFYMNLFVFLKLFALVLLFVCSLIYLSTYTANTHTPFT